MNIIFPKEWVCKKTKSTAYDRAVSGDGRKIITTYTREANRGTEITTNSSYIDGYRRAIKDIKLLNK